MRIKSQRR